MATSATLLVTDQTLDGTAAHRDAPPIELTFPTHRITVRELIRERVYQEVEDHNRDLANKPVFRGLVTPTDAEVTLNGSRLRKPRTLDWKAQYEKAVAAFEAKAVLILVDDRQAESLDDTIEIERGTEVSFLKLTPLVGG